MKKWLLVLVIIIVGCGRSDPLPTMSIKENARRASVQVTFDIPVVKVSFSEPLEKENLLDLDSVSKVIGEKIKEALQIEKELQSQEKYDYSLTTLTHYGYKPKSSTYIPIGAMAPKWAKFPERVLVVWKTETKSITAWEKEYEQDVLSISETAGVSPSQAKSIISRLKFDGYTISKDAISPDSAVELLWFRSGWDDSYPTKLDWKVTTEGEDDNRIKGYDPRGIIEISPVSDDSRVNVEAGYFDLKDEFKPKSSRMEKIEQEVEDLKKEIEDAKDKLLEKEKPEKRDITKVTNMDVYMGYAVVDRFYVEACGSGVFLGNMKARKEMNGFQWSWSGGGGHSVFNENKGVILTNAHVAAAATDFYIMVSEDKEVMYFILPGAGSVRYTQNSDTKGTPAQLLFYDEQPVMSWDYDSAIMVTTAIPQYQKHKAVLGNSDNVKEGDPVVMVGNPSFMQKFLTEGVVSNTSYSFMQSALADSLISDGIPRKWYNWLLNSNFWIDTPIGVGGTSGSGVWALSGSEAGKVISLHNMGLVSPVAAVKDKYKIARFTGSLPIDDRVVRLSDSIKEYKNIIFDGFDSDEKEVKEDAVFLDLIEKHGVVKISGMNGGIPINKVKQYLQERGLDPETFGWEGLGPKYWLN